MIGRFALLLIVSLLVFPRGHDPGTAEPATDYVPGEVLVRWNEADVSSLIAATGAQAADVLVGGVWRLRVAPGAERAAVDAASSHLATGWAQLNYERHLLESATDPRFGEQWALQKMQVPEAWDTNKGDPKVIVAVIDTGVDLTHPDLQERLVEGFNFLRPEEPPQDDAGHGTHAAGTIAATMNNGVGVAGVAPGVSIMPLKAIGRRGTGNDATVASAIRYAADHGAWVINMSFGGANRSPALEEAVAYASGLGVVLVASAGNDGRASPIYPAATKPSIAVAATNIEDGKPGYTNFGNWITVAAPGSQILSTFWDQTSGSGYRILSGTSMAAPHVSGIAALLFSTKPGISAAEITTILQTTADPIGGTGLGTGRVNAGRALAAVASPPPAAPNNGSVPNGPPRPALTLLPTPSPIPTLSGSPVPVDTATPARTSVRRAPVVTPGR